jgi:3'-phosphoadenosine 5'-phosphosulfate sulfotransferase (PAPS reductase)/FAD synthetase
MNPTIDLEASLAVLDEAFEQQQPSHVFALFSGGHDSLTATTIAQQWAQARKIWVPVAHVNTGTGIKETRDFVIETAQEHSWPLMELHPPRSYESLVREMGFPGPGFHDRLAYPRLKERSFRNLARLAPKDGKVMFITGIRQQESVRRIEHVERIQVYPRVVWAAPIWDWEKIDCNHFIAERGLKRNLVSDLLHISGECLCGAMAKPGELDEIEKWFPERAAEIRALEDEVEQSGIRACRWGKTPPAVAKDQMRMFLTPNDGSYPMLCSNCVPQMDQEEIRR